MKKKLSKRTGCLMIALCLFILECSAISAKELPVIITQLADLENLDQYDTDDDGFVVGIVVASEPSENTPNGGIQPMSTVYDNGVRLRSGPSTSSTVLQLMYKYETVIINRQVSNLYPGWYFLNRVQTDTWGYASAKYILA